jgi:hypothetical protein
VKYLISAEADEHLNWKWPGHKKVSWNLKGCILKVNSASSKSTWYIPRILNAWLLTLSPLWAVISPFLDLTSVDAALRLVVGAVSLSHGYAINKECLNRRLTEGFVLPDLLLAPALRFVKEKVRSSVKPFLRTGLLLLLFILSVTQRQDPGRYLLFILNSYWYMHVIVLVFIPKG